MACGEMIVVVADREESRYLDVADSGLGDRTAGVEVTPGRRVDR